MTAADAPSKPLSWSELSDAASEIGASGALAITAISVAMAVSLQPLQFRLVQLLEGYWPTWTPRFLAQLGVWSENRRRDRLISRISDDRPSESSAARIAAAERQHLAESQV